MASPTPVNSTATDVAARHRVTVLEGRLDGAGRRLAVVAAKYHRRLVDKLIDGAVDALVRHGVKRDDIRVVRVPGAWELPLALDELARTGLFDALVALAVVVRGETAHFDYVCSGCADGVARVTDRHRLPVGFGVLTCDTPQQAEARAGGGAGNKGAEAAAAAIEMADLAATLRADELRSDGLRGDGLRAGETGAAP